MEISTVYSYGPNQTDVSETGVSPVSSARVDFIHGAPRRARAATKVSSCALIPYTPFDGRKEVLGIDPETFPIRGKGARCVETVGMRRPLRRTIAVLLNDGLLQVVDDEKLESRLRRSAAAAHCVTTPRVRCMLSPAIEIRRLAATRRL